LDVALLSRLLVGHAVRLLPKALACLPQFKRLGLADSQEAEGQCLFGVTVGAVAKCDGPRRPVGPDWSRSFQQSPNCFSAFVR
jgi:hypothetical protein